MTTCLTHVAPPQLRLFRNYDLNTAQLTQHQKDFLGYENPKNVAIWKAARCSRFLYINSGLRKDKNSFLYICYVYIGAF